MAQILLVEDDPSTLQAYLLGLRAKGHQVVGVGTVEEALALLHGERFDLVLTDLDLPDGFGLDVVRRAGQAAPPTPALIASANGDEEDIAAGLEAGALDYLVKPVPLSLLTSKIARIFSERARTSAERLLPGGDRNAFGRFRIRRVLGSGGQGTVYLADDAKTGLAVALKVRLANTGEDFESVARRRVQREVHALSSLRHPGLAAFVCAGNSADADYVGMEYVEGPTLSDYVVEFGPLKPAVLIDFLCQLCDALEGIHALSLVHRDVKPSNVILRGGDPAQPVLIDFGLAKLGFDRTLTKPGERHGTPRYMSPEQVTGRELTGRSDLFALGLLATFAASGKHPFPDLAGIEAARALASRPARVPVDLPSPLRAAIKRALKLDPQQRPADARAMGVLLREALQSSGADGNVEGHA